MKLNTEQVAALQAVAEADEEYRQAKVTLRAQLILEMEHKLEKMSNRRAQRAFDAWQLGVPKRRIGVEGLNTTDPKTTMQAIEDGRAIQGGGMSDLSARAQRTAVLEKAKPAEPLYTHDGTGEVLATNQPFSVGDEPGVYVLTSIMPNTQPIPFRLDEKGWPKPVEGAEFDASWPLLLGSSNVAKRVRAAAIEFAAGAQSR